MLLLLPKFLHAQIRFKAFIDTFCLTKSKIFIGVKRENSWPTTWSVFLSFCFRDRNQLALIGRRSQLQLAPDFYLLAI